MATKRAPVGLKKGGKALWKDVYEEFELGLHEEAVLLQACRTVDLLDELQRVMDEGRVVVASPQGLKAHPAAVEFRQQAATLAKLIASLRIPLDEEQEAGRGQRRSGVRALRGVA